MKPKQYFVNLIYLLLFEFIFKYYTLAQNGLCSLDTNGLNICDRSDRLVSVIESEYNCRMAGTKCWCILIDNRNRIFDGDMVIELVQIFNRDNLHYALAQNGVCSFYTTGLNICERPDRLVSVIESEYGCRTAGTKCWCILIDNRNRIFDGDLVIELVQIFNSFNLQSDDTQFGQVKSYLTFKIVAGLNRVHVQPYTPPEAVAKITSIKIRNNEICRFSNFAPGSNYNFQESTNTNNPFIPFSYQERRNQQDTNFNDCLRRKDYTENSITYCSNYRREFMIEKRMGPTNQQYWCIHINNDNNLFSSANHLHIVYSSPNRRYFYSPENAYFERDIPGSDFHLGNRRTIISISEHNNQLTDLNSVTIDNHPICSYFEPRVTTPAPVTYNRQFFSFNPQITQIPDTPAIQQVPDQATKLFIPPRETIKIPNVNLAKYPSVVQEEPNIIVPASSSKDCGTKPINRNSLISFGLKTNPGDWPWHAAIYRLQTKTNRNYICGGTLIDRKTIVTAAHCVLELNLVVIPDRLTVELGRHDLTTASVATREYRIYDVLPHESYNPDSFENDIALLILANYVELTQYVNFICLPHPNEDILNRLGTTVGWGRDHNNELQPDLKEANLPVVDYIKCLTSNREFFGHYLTSTNFCAGFMNNTNVCRGDSGGGLVFKLNNQWVLGGITSLGVLSKTTTLECDLSQYVIFTDVRKFVIWIKRHS